MLKKIPLSLSIAVVSATTVVSCSSDKEPEKNEAALYSSDHTAHLQGTSKNVYGGLFTFNTRDTQTTDNALSSWKFSQTTYKQAINGKKSKVYDREKSATYFETNYIFYDGILESDIESDITDDNTNKVKYTYPNDDSDLDLDNYSLAKSN